MRKYPFSPELLDALPEALAAQYRKLEETLLEEICSRLKLAGQLNEVTVQAIRALRSHGIDLKAIEQAIAETAGISERDLDALLTDVVLRNQQYYTQLLTLADVTQPEQLVDAAAVEAIRVQTMSTFRNLTASMGFLVNAGRTVLPPSQAYQWALDQAVLQMQTGAVSYDRAIQSAVKQLASSGLKVVNYASGHADQIDVAARRAVMTGVSQICAQYTEQSAAYLDTPYFEISAHVGARDKPGPSPWSSHKAWQGRVYSTRSGDIYPNIYETCGLGYVDGLEGANCRHRRFPWIEGVSERTYTDAQLAHIDDGKGGTFDGVTYTAYEATQMQRKLERTIRKVRREKKAYQAAGLTDDATASGIRLRRLNEKYTGFCQAADLPTQKERLKVLYVDADSTAAAETQKEQLMRQAAANAQADLEALKYFRADARDDLKSIVKRSTIKLKNGFSCFPDGDPLNENVQKVTPLKSYFDVAMHGSPSAVGFGTVELNMSPRLLAAIIRHTKGWNGQNIRLLSCRTGQQIGDAYCFAEELANALGVKVKAPNDILYISELGNLRIGNDGKGKFIIYRPNERRRLR